jgi:hypothetical protein
VASEELRQRQAGGEKLAGAQLAKLAEQVRWPPRLSPAVPYEIGLGRNFRSRGWSGTWMPLRLWRRRRSRRQRKRRKSQTAGMPDRRQQNRRLTTGTTSHLLYIVFCAIVAWRGRTWPYTGPAIAMLVCTPESHSIHKPTGFHPKRMPHASPTARLPTC